MWVWVLGLGLGLDGGEAMVDRARWVSGGHNGIDVVVFMFEHALLCSALLCKHGLLHGTSVLHW